MIAVHMRVPDDEVVLVGRYGQAHDERSATAAAKQIAAKPAGAEIIVPRPIARAEIVAIRELTQLVGWTDMPETERKLRMDCVCPVCLPRGVPDRVRKLNGAYRRGLDAYRRATTTNAKLDALSRVGTVLGEARRRLDEAPLLRIARSDDSEVRQRAAALLGGLPWSRVEAALTKLALTDEDPFVRSRAVGAMLRSAGALRAARTLEAAPERENEVLLNALGDELPSSAVANAIGIILRRHRHRLGAKAARIAKKLLSDDVSDARTRALLETLSGGLDLATTT